MNKETVVEAFLKPSSGRKNKPSHSVLYIIVEPTEEVKKRLYKQIMNPPKELNWRYATRWEPEVSDKWKY